MNRDTLYKFFSHESSAAEEKDVIKWLEETPGSMEEMLRERKVFDTALLTAGRQPGGRRAGRFSAIPRWVGEALRTAAVVALLLGGGYYMVTRQMDEISLKTNTVAVPAGQRVNITLPDGSNVWLNSLSKITYPALFSGGERRVKLTGEAFFDVTGDPGRTFVVETDMFDVCVLGTRFDVISSPSRGEFAASVIEGRVSVTDRRNPDNRIILDPQQEVRFSGGRLVRQKIEDMDVFRWREGLVCFRNASLGELLERFSRSYDVKIVFLEADLPKKEFSGKFRVSDGIVHAMKVLQRDVDFTYEWNEKDNIIYISSGK